MIRFSKYIWLYGLISALVLVPGMYALFRFGLLPSVDFTGGTLLAVHYSAQPSTEQVINAAKSVGVDVTSVQLAADNLAYVRLKPQGDENVTALEHALTSVEFAGATIARSETVGPTIGSELLQKAFTAALLAVFAILLYVAYAFKSMRYGFAAVVALVHDLLVVLGCFAILGVVAKVEVDTLFVTAFLTTMSFSVHDTIVVFDRIREFIRKGERGSFAELCDRALSETMVRSLTNSFTIVFMLLALILLGGETVRWFVVALLIGTISGTYSSPFVATPMLLLMDKLEKRKNLALKGTPFQS